MIDTDLRAKLSEDIRHLATGRMSNDAFDDRYYKDYELSNDLAVRVIANYCYCQYSSDLMWPIYLRGRYALDQETRKTIARCGLFLRSGNEYEWPLMPDNSFYLLLAGIAKSIGFPAGVIVTLVGTGMIITHPDSFALQLLVIGLPFSALCFWIGFLRPTVSRGDWQKFTAAGDYDYWPFLKRESFDDARSHIHVLGR